MKIIFFGGSFNPPHNGHLAMALLMRELFLPDKIILSASRNPFKTSAEISDADRLRLLQLMAQELNETGCVFDVSDWELQQESSSYTIESLRRLRLLFPSSDLMLSIGEDNFRTFSKWKNYEEILDLASLIVFERPDAQTLPDFTPTARTKIFRVSLAIDEASTELRGKIASGKMPQSEIPKILLDYIAEKGLYRN